VALEALINGVKGRTLWKMFYALPNRSLLKVKQAIKKHIWVEEASVLPYVPPCFSKETFP
jgi:hypothetical protein